jgi:hypothetical protein
MERGYGRNKGDIERTEVADKIHNETRICNTLPQMTGHQLFICLK